MLSANINGPGFYRSNPYSRIGYVPPMALKNRDNVRYAGQIPQGRQFFQPTHKKHYEHNFSYGSDIVDSCLINVYDSPNNEVIRKKSYERSLNITDIDGATPNSLMSQAVKNKMKAQEKLHQRLQHEQQKYKIHINKNQDSSKQQQQAEQILRQKKQNIQNYHSQSESNSINNRESIKDQNINKYNQNKKKNYTEEDPRMISIRQLQQQLKANKSMNSKIDQYYQKGYYNQKHSNLHQQQNHNQLRQNRRQQSYLQNKPLQYHQKDYNSGVKYLNNKQSKQQYRQKQKQNFNELKKQVNSTQKVQNIQNQLNNKYYNNLDQNRRYQYHNENRESQNKHTNRSEKIYNQYQNHHSEENNILRNKSEKIQNDSIEQYKQYDTYRQRNYPTKQNYSSKQNEYFQRQNNYKPEQKISLLNGNKKIQVQPNIRNSHPTYLSYGSPSLGLAGRKIVGY